MAVSMFETAEPCSALTTIVRAEAEAADEVFLVAQDDQGEFVGEPIYGSSLHVTA